MTAWRAAVALAAACAAARADVLKVPSDFETIQAAVDASAPGDTILIASGSYPEAVLVSGRNDLTLRGLGQAGIVGLGTLQPGLTITGCIDIRVERLRFSEMPVGVDVSGSSGVELRQCRASLLDEVGFRVTGSDTITLDRCTVEQAGDAGILIEGSAGATLSRCRVTGGETGIFVDGTGAVTIDRARVEGVTKYGILLGLGSSGVDVQRALIVEPGDTGVWIDGSDNCVSRSLVVKPSNCGVLCDSSAAHNVIDRVRVVGSGEASFVLDGTAQEALNCRSVQAVDGGFQCRGNGQHLVRDARILSPDLFGVSLIPGSSGTSIIDSRVSGAFVGITVSDSKIVLVGNVVTGCGGDGLLLTGDFHMVVGNRAHGSGNFDLTATGSTGSTFLDNDFGTVQVTP